MNIVNMNIENYDFSKFKLNELSDIISYGYKIIGDEEKLATIIAFCRIELMRRSLIK